MNTIPNLICNSSLDDGKYLAPLEAHNHLKSYWLTAYHLHKTPEGLFRFLAVVQNELYAFEVTPKAGSVLAWWFDYYQKSKRVELKLYRRRVNGVLRSFVSDVQEGVL